MTKKLNTRKIKQAKKSSTNKSLSMLTCYDYQTAQLLNETSLDMILVGDSLGNVILGFETTLEVTLDHMKIFAAAVKRGATEKFIVCDMPFGSYNFIEQAVTNATDIMQTTGVDAIKIEGASSYHLELIKKLTSVGIPVVGHIGLTPQSVHELGGYYTHGKNEESAKNLLTEAQLVSEAGCFCLVLECITSEISKEITERINIPTIGIGAGKDTDGQVLVINDLFKLGSDYPPSFCSPVADLYRTKKELLENYLDEL